MRGVAGAKPGLLRARLANGTALIRRLSWWDGASWVELKADYHPEQLNEREFPDRAWVRPDGAMLILTHEKLSGADPEKGLRYRLQLARRNGQVSDACKECGALELGAAALRWLDIHCPADAAFDLASVTSCALAEDSDFVRVDPEGRYLVLPEGEEMIVIDLSAGTQRLRTPFGKPIAIDAEKVTLLLPDDKGSAEKPRLAVFRMR